MILLGSNLTDSPIVSIQTGGVIGSLTRPIIDPATLSIMAYQVTGPLIHTNPTYLRIADIRELSDMGAIVDSADEFNVQGDIIKLDELEKLRFTLLGMHVKDEKRKKLGKVTDFTIDVGSFYIQQLTVHRPLMHSLNDTELLIHRTQIIEINNDAIVVHSAAQAPEPERTEVIGSYVNPFRQNGNESATESISAQKG
jgi:uncharacterized protein YrrD